MSRRILNEEIGQMGYIRKGRTGSRSTAANKLRDAIYRYFCNTDEIDIYVPIIGSRDWRPIKKTIMADGELSLENSRVLKIVYKSEDRQGLSWILWYDNHSREYSEYIIEAKINPKVFIGISDYITASNESHLLEVERKFNDEVNKLSPLLGRFAEYKPKRIDYCINFDLRELGVTCTPMQMMRLIKRGDYSSYFQEYKYYDRISHRKKSFEHSHYLKSGSVNINCYNKYYQLKKQFPSCPSIDDAQHIIRFEVQCKYRKTYMMLRLEQEQMKRERDSPSFNRKFAESNIINRSIDDPIRIIHRMLSDMMAEDIITKYFRQIVKFGDYYTLADAIKLVEAENLTPTTEMLIIDTLKIINNAGIAKTRTYMTQAGLTYFYKVMDILEKLNINPVTIPKSYKIKHIPNLFTAYKNSMNLCRLQALHTVLHTTHWMSHTS